MNRPLYTVEMSTDGKHRVIVTIEDPNGTDAALAWASATHAKLLRAISDTPNGHQPYDDDVVPECGVHHLPMTKVQGRSGAFWSCHQKNVDGSWCKFRPSGEA